MSERYGRVKFTTIYRAKDDLRKAIQEEGTPRIQDAWDRLEQWIDSPPMMPTTPTEHDRRMEE